MGTAAHAAEVEEGRAIKVHCRCQGLEFQAPPGSLPTEPACMRGTGCEPQVHQGAAKWASDACVLMVFLG